jgi:hypothetical protein
MVITNMSFFAVLYLRDEVFYLHHQCYQLADFSATDLKRGQTKSGAYIKICCHILADFVQKELKRGRTSGKFVFSS